MKRQSVLLLLTVLVLVCLLIFLWLRYRPAAEKLVGSAAAPLLIIDVNDTGDALPLDTLHPRYEKTGFVLAYNEEHEQAAWVSYILTREMVLSDNAERSDRFREDTAITTGSAHPSDYLRSGFDRGHLAPAADMKWSARAMEESFLMSNMSPQKPGFNRGIWRLLEEQVRDWAVAEERLYVVTGPVLSEVSSTIGENRVGVPAAYFKAILDTSPPDFKCIGFLMPHESYSGSLFRYALSIDSLESVIQLDLFSGQDQATMNWLEARVDTLLWK